MTEKSTQLTFNENDFTNVIKFIKEIDISEFIHMYHEIGFVNSDPALKFWHMAKSHFADWWIGLNYDLHEEVKDKNLHEEILTYVKKFYETH